MKLIVGMGRSGKAAKELLSGEEVACFDDQGEWPPVVWEKVTQVIVSPGIPPTHPLYREAVARGIEVIGEAELALSRLPNRIVGVTGTNGKTTFVSLLAHVIDKGVALGNIGEPFSLFANDPDPEAIVIAELSSFQLETMKSCTLTESVVLNITPDHLDRYPSFAAYREAKMRIAQLTQGALYVPADLKPFFPTAVTLAETSYLQLWKKDQYWAGRERFSLAVAFLIANHYGVGAEEFWERVSTFSRPAHRMEWVAEKGGVVYINDSKGTNLAATIHAAESVGTGVVLIAGGVLKEGSFAPWKEALKGRVKGIVAMGESAELLESELAGAFSVTRASSLSAATRLAKELAGKGDTVLLSPGCASFDAFANYEERGDAFKEEVKRV
jgi:UDP-N-acetylmuramoylalanine--D-glutamate ligase